MGGRSPSSPALVSTTLTGAGDIMGVGSGTSPPNSLFVVSLSPLPAAAAAGATVFLTTGLRNLSLASINAADAAG